MTAHRMRDASPEAAEAERERARQKSRAWRLMPGNIERERAAKAAWKAAHPDEWKAQKAASSARYAERNAEKIKAKRDAVRAALRADVIEAYGGRCNCPGCHVVHAVLLTIDHIEPVRHRRNGRVGYSTYDLYRWLQKRGFPPEFQLLCGSCNLAKADRDKCPLAGEDH